MSPKFGGMLMRSGLHTFRVQHLLSISKSAVKVKRIVNGWNGIEVAKRETGGMAKQCLSRCREPIDVGTCDMGEEAPS